MRIEVIGQIRAYPEGFIRGGPIFFNLKLMMGERIQIALKVDHHLPASESAI